MEESCFGAYSRSSARTSKQMRQQKIARGLLYPIYLITSSYNSRNLSILQQCCEKQKITLAFQQSISVLHKVPSTFTECFFVVMNDFDQQQTVGGQFNSLECQILYYPQNSISDILARYNDFVALYQLKKTGRMFMGKAEQDKQNLCETLSESKNSSCSNNGNKIICRNVSKLHKTYQSESQRRLFIFSNKNDDQHFKNYKSKIQKQFLSSHTKNISLIHRIQDYLCEIPTKGDQHYSMLMSRQSLQNYRHFFKKADQFIVYVKDVQDSMNLLKGKVVQLVSQEDTLDRILFKKFDLKLCVNDYQEIRNSAKMQKFSLASTMAQSFNQRGWARASLSSETKQPTNPEKQHRFVSSASSDFFKCNFKPIPQASDCVVDSQDISKSSLPLQASQTEQQSIPLHSLCLQSFDSSSDSKIFGEIVNQLGASSSQFSKMSNRTNKKSRILNKIQKYKKSTQNRPLIESIIVSESKQNQVS